VRILLVSGSTRTASTNTAALRTAQSVAPDQVAATLYDRLGSLPQFNPDDDHQSPHPAVRDLRREIAAANALLFCTPEYAGSMPGSLKNLLEWTVSSGELYRKPAAWVNVAAPGRSGGAYAELATVLEYLGTDVVEPACAHSHVPKGGIGPDGLVTTGAFRAKVADTLETIAGHVRARDRRVID
jgi:chromate reductase, NAD(P)H dehydrogenase (quinone)